MRGSTESASQRAMMVPLAASKPHAEAGVIPRRCSSITCAPKRLATAALSSVHPLSTTITSSGCRSCPAKDARQSSNKRASFRTGMTTDIRWLMRSPSGKTGSLSAAGGPTNTRRRGSSAGHEDATGRCCGSRRFVRTAGCSHENPSARRKAGVPKPGLAFCSRSARRARSSERAPGPRNGRS